MSVETEKLRNALQEALAFIKWQAFGRRMTTDGDIRPASPDHVVAVIEDALIAEQPTAQKADAWMVTFVRGDNENAWAVDLDEPDIGFIRQFLPEAKLVPLYTRTTEPAAVPMVLYCPRCATKHIDAPSEGWDNPPHRSHLCHVCGCIWRPADVPTVGVACIETVGKADNWMEGDAAEPAAVPDYLPDGTRVEWEDNFGKWHAGTIIGYTPATYSAELDDGVHATGYARGRFRLLATREGQ